MSYVNTSLNRYRRGNGLLADDLRIHLKQTASDIGNIIAGRHIRVDNLPIDLNLVRGITRVVVIDEGSGAVIVLHIYCVH